MAPILAPVNFFLVLTLLGNCELLITLLMIYWQVGKGGTEEKKREREKIIMLAC